jgi:bacterial/archaeal transporter family protein
LKTWSASWLFWALLSAVFAAVTAIFAKIGVANINSDLATLFRTVVIAVVLAAILALTKQFQPLASISTRTYAFLALSGIATGASWLCYFRALKLGEASRVAPVDKLSIVLVAVFGVVFLGERRALTEPTEAPAVSLLANSRWPSQETAKPLGTQTF